MKLFNTSMVLSALFAGNVLASSLAAVAPKTLVIKEFAAQWVEPQYKGIDLFIDAKDVFEYSCSDAKKKSGFEFVAWTQQYQQTAAYSSSVGSPYAPGVNDYGMSLTSFNGKYPKGGGSISTAVHAYVDSSGNYVLVPTVAAMSFMSDDEPDYYFEIFSELNTFVSISVDPTTDAEPLKYHFIQVNEVTGDRVYTQVICQFKNNPAALSIVKDYWESMGLQNITLK